MSNEIQKSNVVSVEAPANVWLSLLRGKHFCRDYNDVKRLVDELPACALRTFTPTEHTKAQILAQMPELKHFRAYSDESVLTLNYTPPTLAEYVEAWDAGGAGGYLYIYKKLNGKDMEFRAHKRYGVYWVDSLNLTDDETHEEFFEFFEEVSMLINEMSNLEPHVEKWECFALPE